MSPADPTGARGAIAVPELLPSVAKASGRVGWYGLFDTVDEVWLGTDGGPTTFEDEVIARAAALLADEQLGWRWGRTVARRYDGGATRPRDEIPVRRSAHAALRRLEAVREGVERWKPVADLAREHNRLDAISGFAARDKRRTLKAKIVTAACEAALLDSAARAATPEGA